jgi:hypothetical protein
MCLKAAATGRLRWQQVCGGGGEFVGSVFLVCVCRRRQRDCGGGMACFGGGGG